MTGVNIEMREIKNLNPAPYIDEARKIIAVTRESLGAGEPASGTALDASAQRVRASNNSVRGKITALDEQSQGYEAWFLILIPQIEWLIALDWFAKHCANSASQHINFHAIDIRSCRRHLDGVITGLENTRVHVLAISAVDLAAARTTDLEAAESAMASYNQGIRLLQEETEKRVQLMNSLCTELERTIRAQTGSLGRPNSRTGSRSIRIPHEQLMSTSGTLSAYAVDVAQSTCEPAFLENVVSTHGSFATADFIAALSRFIELYNQMSTIVSADLQRLAERLANAAQDYLLTDAMAAKSIVARAASPC